ncbi:MAG: hypothetical protein U9R72_05505 [Chloroflexota bacterium]|nr:hypothetical protein [Chloroflexota bacterium]
MHQLSRAWPVPRKQVTVGKITVGIRCIHIKHDDYTLWEQVPHGLANEFVAMLREESLLQERHTELKDDVMEFVELDIPMPGMEDRRARDGRENLHLVQLAYVIRP